MYNARTDFPFPTFLFGKAHFPAQSSARANSPSSQLTNPGCLAMTAGLIDQQLIYLVPPVIWPVAPVVRVSAYDLLGPEV